MHPLPYSQTITLIQRVLSATKDQYGNDVYTDVQSDVPFCVVAPAISTEDIQWTEHVSTDITVFVPAGTVVGPLDAFLINGNKYEVHGDPNQYQSPFSGHYGPTQIRASKVTGASV
jgi:hypothetical protein